MSTPNFQASTPNEILGDRVRVRWELGIVVELQH